MQLLVAIKVFLTTISLCLLLHSLFLYTYFSVLDFVGVLVVVFAIGYLCLCVLLLHYATPLELYE